jgi:DegV family protein with EDD domain
MAMGYAVVRAAEVAAAGGSPDEVAGAAVARAAASSAFFYVDTLEYLRRGGRIGAAAALLGSALAVKPLLRLVDGRIAPLEKVRTTSRALARLEEIAVERAGQVEVDMAVHHLASPARADQLAARLRTRIPGLRELLVSEVGAVVGAHVGPGMLAVVLSPV